MKDAERLQNLLRTGRATGLDVFKAALNEFDDKIVTCSVAETEYGCVTHILFIDRSAARIKFHDAEEKVSVKVVEDIVTAATEAVAELLARDEKEEKGG